MIALGLESATELVGAAVADAAGVRAAAWSRGRRRHVESLAPAIEQVLAQAAIPLSAVEVVVVDVGPGLFTGLRVGVATAQGLAQGLGIAVLPIGSLEVIAAAVFASGWPGAVLSVVDARRGEVFTAAYERAGALVRELVAPAVGSPAGLAAAAQAARAAGGTSEVLAAGDGVLRYADELRASGVVLAGSGFVAPSPAALVALGIEQLAAGAAPVAPAAVRPVYLRPPDVRINWALRQPAPARG
ncbi:MAG TPA: tRNA (adenosine(37)-N6)-threonylcarbamoyltransferase complex dimerization subunit type 1 TsaB [Acidimicrobiales bacterium]|nr:tRNA (adenosine(37)-N6)-threonylcarbamoyltransferase complex dimerization subunit type 1 TsaB [Acidimicrobiales bacterium]